MSAFYVRVSTSVIPGGYRIERQFLRNQLPVAETPQRCELLGLARQP